MGQADHFYKWLGIPHSEQPPNFYQLLGLEKFEVDVGVISDAAERQIEHVRGYEKGGTVNDAREVLNELERAKRCLLNSDQKRAYDTNLGVGGANRAHANYKSDEFDPYYQWLGIPPAHQPPTHYRLLGISSGETNAEVIQAATDRQMSHIRRKAISQRGEFSERILTELAAACVCLLDPRKRAAYDHDLQASKARETAAKQESVVLKQPTNPPSKPAIAPAKPKPAPRRPAATPQIATTTTSAASAPVVAKPLRTDSFPSSSNNSGRPSNNLVAAVVAGALGTCVVVLVLGVLFASRGWRTPSDSNRDIARETTRDPVTDNLYLPDETRPREAPPLETQVNTDKPTRNDSSSPDRENNLPSLPSEEVPSDNFPPSGGLRSDPTPTPEVEPPSPPINPPTESAAPAHPTIKVVRTITFESRVCQLAFSPDGGQLAIGCEGTLEVLAVPDGEAALQMDRDPVMVKGLSFSSDGADIIAAYPDKITVWDPKGNIVKDMRFDDRIHDMSAIARSTRLLVYGTDPTTEDRYISEIDTRLMKMVHRSAVSASRQPQGDAFLLATSANGRVAAFAYGSCEVSVNNLSPRGSKSGFFAQGNSIGGLALSPDGHTAVTSCGDGKVRTWNTKTANRKLILTDQFRRPARLCFAPNAEFIAVTGELKSKKNLSVQILDAEKGDLIATLNLDRLQPTFEDPICISPDSRYIAVGGTGDEGGVVHVVTIVDPEESTEVVAVSPEPVAPPVLPPEPDRPLEDWPKIGRQIYSREWPKLAGALAFSQDSQELAIGSFGAVTLIDPRGKVIREMKDDFGSVWDLEFHSDGKRIIAITGEGGRGKNDHSRVRSLEIASGKFTSHPSSQDAARFLGTSTEIRNLSLFAGTEKVLLPTAAHTPIVLDLNTGEFTEADKLPVAARNVEEIAAARDNTTFVVGDSRGGVYLYNASNGKMVDLLYSHQYRIHALAYSDDGEVLYSTGGDIYAWDVRTGRTRFHLDRAAMNGFHCVRFAVSPDGRLLAAASATSDGAVMRIYNARTGELITSRTEGERGSSIGALAFSPDGKLFAAAYDRMVDVWELDD